MRDATRLTWGDAARAARSMLAELRDTPPDLADDDAVHAAYRRLKAVKDGLYTAWTSPAQREAAYRLSDELAAAWNRAMGHTA